MEFNLLFLFMVFIFGSVNWISALEYQHQSKIIDDKKYRILILSAYTCRSHMNVFLPIAKALIAKGHEVTIATPYTVSDKVSGLKEEIVFPKAANVFQTLSDELFIQNFNNPFTFMSFLSQAINFTCYEVFTHPRIQEFLKQASLKKAALFDVVLLNAYFNECTYAIGYVLADVMVSVSSADIFTWTAAFMGMSYNPAVLPMAFICPNIHLNFHDRISNTLIHGVAGFIREFVYKRTSQNAVDKLLAGVPSISDLEEKTALALVNHDPLLHSTRAFIPNVIPIPAIHCRPAETLPKDLFDFVESSGEDGFILFSLGTIVKASLLSKKIQDTFIKAFSQLKQKVIWKLETMPENLPENIKVMPWVPQQDLLGNPKIRLLITHGGLFSIQESFYHGVPVIAVPVFADQPYNVRKLHELGLGLEMNIDNLTSDGILNKINDILSKPSYEANVKKYSRIVRDTPLSSSDTAVFWIEYVIRHQGATHLNVNEKQLYWFQYFLLDIFILLVLLLFLIYLLVRFVSNIVRKVLRYSFILLKKQKKS